LQSFPFPAALPTEATYCTATTETPPVVSHFAAASLSGTVQQAEMNVSNAKKKNALFIKRNQSPFKQLLSSAIMLLSKLANIYK
jgi:hypothetical protein